MRILIYLLGILFLTNQDCEGQINKKEKDSVYYYLDTAAVAIKDRMVFKDSLAYGISYYIPCKCNLGGSNINFEKSKFAKSKAITLDEFKKIKTVSITDLLSIVVNKITDKSKITSYFIIEPSGKAMKISQVLLMDPRRTEVIDKGGVYIKPIKK
ncbi:hypothetical protein [Pedobacter gandavensis]|uniref:hypothetical protein n=1 Tax=Pedobacter gandavensis TaxID=2679963 RepID=UPI002930A1D6|nr:hypothetical protein [Pedobacter gandavensis]